MDGRQFLAAVKTILVDFFNVCWQFDVLKKETVGKYSIPKTDKKLQFGEMFYKKVRKVNVNYLGCFQSGQDAIFVGVPAFEAGLFY